MAAPPPRESGIEWVRRIFGRSGPAEEPAAAAPSVPPIAPVASLTAVIPDPVPAAPDAVAAGDGTTPLGAVRAFLTIVTGRVW